MLVGRIQSCEIREDRTGHAREEEDRDTNEHRRRKDNGGYLGRIVAADGPVVEARFDTAEAPEVHTALALEDGGGALHVIQRLPDGRVRGLAAAGLPTGVGTRVVGTNETLAHPLKHAHGGHH